MNQTDSIASASSDNLDTLGAENTRGKILK